MMDNQRVSFPGQHFTQEQHDSKYVGGYEEQEKKFSSPGAASSISWALIGIVVVFFLVVAGIAAGATVGIIVCVTTENSPDAKSSSSPKDVHVPGDVPASDAVPVASGRGTETDTAERGTETVMSTQDADGSPLRHVENRDASRGDEEIGGVSRNENGRAHQSRRIADGPADALRGKKVLNVALHNARRLTTEQKQELNHVRRTARTDDDWMIENWLMRSPAPAGCSGTVNPFRADRGAQNVRNTSRDRESREVIVDPNEYGDKAANSTVLGIGMLGDEAFLSRIEGVVFHGNAMVDCLVESAGLDPVTSGETNAMHRIFGAQCPAGVHPVLQKLMEVIKQRNLYVMVYCGVPETVHAAREKLQLFDAPGASEKHRKAHEFYAFARERLFVNSDRYAYGKFLLAQFTTIPDFRPAGAKASSPVFLGSLSIEDAAKAAWDERKQEAQRIAAKKGAVPSGNDDQVAFSVLGEPVWYRKRLVVPYWINQDGQDVYAYAGPRHSLVDMAVREMIRKSPSLMAGNDSTSDDPNFPRFFVHGSVGANPLQWQFMGRPDQRPFFTVSPIYQGNYVMHWPSMESNHKHWLRWTTAQPSELEDRADNMLTRPSQPFGFISIFERTTKAGGNCGVKTVEFRSQLEPQTYRAEPNKIYARKGYRSSGSSAGPANPQEHVDAYVFTPEAFQACGMKLHTVIEWTRYANRHEIETQNMHHKVVKIKQTDMAGGERTTDLISPTYSSFGTYEGFSSSDLNEANDYGMFKVP